MANSKASRRGRCYVLGALVDWIFKEQVFYLDIVLSHDNFWPAFAEVIVFIWFPIPLKLHYSDIISVHYSDMNITSLFRYYFDITIRRNQLRIALFRYYIPIPLFRYNSDIPLKLCYFDITLLFRYNFAIPPKSNISYFVSEMVYC